MEHKGSPQYHAPSYASNPPAPSRIPRIALTTVGNITEAIKNWAPNLMSIRKQSPEYHHMIFDDSDCEGFLAACCSAEEQAAFHLVRTGTQKNNVFISLFMRDIGGVTIEQDSILLKPLAAVIPTWAAYAFMPKVCSRSKVGCWDYGFLSAEPSTPHWAAYAQRVVNNVLTQATHACNKDIRGCWGYWGCVQESTAMGPYERSKDEVLRDYGCDMTEGPWRPDRCAASSRVRDDTLRRISLISESPIKHNFCHAKKGARLQCKRPNETQAHYVSKSEANWWYVRSEQGLTDGSSAPGYYWPLCCGHPAPERVASNHNVSKLDASLRGEICSRLKLVSTEATATGLRGCGKSCGKLFSSRGLNAKSVIW